MNNFSTLYPALLFPAIPLMMISFGNRYTSLAALIRKIHDLIVVNHLSKKNAKHYLDQIKVLTQRLALVRASQTLSGVSFILNLLSIYCSYIENYEIALNFFGFGVLVFALAILTFIYEIQLSTKALSKHLEDLKDLS
ncbi:DUF2721 domain-containing protein [Alphaproteobacteria bacterium]|jgi:hypothetical protein|nr:DUF2721 domain-containing protein [Alphaproteobacteria bacterium]MDB2636333.1 DUF2721 domain-containing protein [Alphaproteobacteria bacterium]MDB3973922.1 DUF2721 domain-containing protein [Alphaproteobacteria bacterium]MDC0968748.1 DUF2721 domain-containing protein [Alphaproteobacteria bacterium]OUX25342.1 MAG: hypothetical protein CBE19_00275 [Pelagibacteraceae bacterium TMED259]|tara:strand:+ start:242 stop:655 length:414 start_codon:yes stop_codon:yes gene_type:complete